MKYCKYCGTQLADDAVCHCPAAEAERQAQNGYTQPQREEKSVVQKFIDTLSRYFSNPKQAVDKCIREKDFVTAFICIGALFVVMLGVKCCIYGTEAVKGRPYVNFNFGLTLLAALIAVTALCAAYVLSRFIILMVCGKKPVDAVQLMTDALISFGVNSVVPMGLLLVGGLFYMAADMPGYMFFAVAAVWYIVSGLQEIKDDFAPGGNLFVRLLITSVIIGALIALYFLLYRGLYSMNVKTVFGSSYNDYDTLFNNFRY